MSTDQLTRIVLASRPRGKPTIENFRLKTAPLPHLPHKGVLLRTLYLSLDPYMRGRMDDRKSYAKPVGLGETMTGEGVAEVIASRMPRPPSCGCWRAAISARRWCGFRLGLARARGLVQTSGHESLAQPRPRRPRDPLARRDRRAFARTRRVAP